MTKITFLHGCELLLGVWLVPMLLAQPAAPLVSGVDPQPIRAQAARIGEALEYLGEPLTPGQRQQIAEASRMSNPDEAVAALQRVLDERVLFYVEINPEMRVKVASGGAKAELDEGGWRNYLIKVKNDSGTTAELRVVSPQAMTPFEGGSLSTDSDKHYRRRGVERAVNPDDAWLDLAMFNGQPLRPQLSGLGLEYRIVQLYSRDAGRREAKFAFNVGQGTQDLGFRSEIDVLFQNRAAREVVLSVKDEWGKPATATFVIRDRAGRVYPSQAKRLAPDFAFHPQVYRADGETLELPDGEYAFEFSRGPESLLEKRQVRVDEGTRELVFGVRRWIDPAKMGWWSGDHHIHAAGCAHYTKPSEGVHAKDMIRHCEGEDLKIGANLTWGPCFDYQKQFFTGLIDPVSKYPYLLRYDIEVSGFGSHQSGHLCLLRLKDQIYPGGDSKDHWPTLGLNTLRWAKKQGAVCGPAHSGWGLEVQTSELPNYEIPPFNGIGANEYIVDVTHEVPGPDGKLVPAVDFISTVDTPYVWELNIWYHTLNCGFRTRISGETDFPCIYGERVGLGRSYVKLDGELDYDRWCQGIREGRNYVGDGRSHLIDFSVNGVVMGEDGSELRLSEAGNVEVRARVAAYLNEEPNPQLQRRPYQQKPYWDVERARIGSSRNVKLELIVNGRPVASKEIVADGELRDVTFQAEIERSSWVALRILPSSHSNPVFVLVDGKPIRASKRSVEWCLKGVDQCWSQKQRFIRANEMADAKSAYEHARQVYRRILAESEVD